MFKRIDPATTDLSESLKSRHINRRSPPAHRCQNCPKHLQRPTSCMCPSGKNLPALHLWASLRCIRVVAIYLSHYGFTVDPAGIPTLIRFQNVTHQLGGSTDGHSGFAERCPTAETMPQRVRRQGYQPCWRR